MFLHACKPTVSLFYCNIFLLQASAGITVPDDPPLGCDCVTCDLSRWQYLSHTLKCAYRCVIIVLFPCSSQIFSYYGEKKKPFSWMIFSPFLPKLIKAVVWSGAVLFWPGSGSSLARCRLQLQLLLCSPQFVAEKKVLTISLLNLPGLVLFTERYECFALLLQFFA